MGYGASGYIGISRETAGWGTPAAVASGDFFYALNENVTLTIDRFDTRNIVAVRSEPDDTAGGRHVGGENHTVGPPPPIRQWLRGGTNLRQGRGILSRFLCNNNFYIPPTDAGTVAPRPP